MTKLPVMQIRKSRRANAVVQTAGLAAFQKRFRRATVRLAILGLPTVLLTPAVAAQRAPQAVSAEVFAGGELERYLRALQAIGAVQAYPWSIRGFAPAEIGWLAPADSTHPWQARFDFRRKRGLTLTRPSVGARYNSAFPYGSHDGPLWAGRGATLHAGAGVTLQWGPITAIAAPQLFWTENRAFRILENGLDGPPRYADGQHPHGVDRPQRFGNRSYGRVDAGHSTLRADAYGASVGVSHAHQWWGPTGSFPFLLGDNAPGFAHVFAGTTRPVDLWLADVHGRVIWGQLEQSEYFESPVAISRPRRFATGMVVVVQPRGLRELELGASRFVHAPWPDEGLPGRYLTRAFEGLLKRSLGVVGSPIDDDDRSSDGENQLASIFARLALPGSGMEAYVEFGREDHSWDGRDLILMPDWLSSLTLGLRRAWRRSPTELLVLRGETINFQLNSVSRVRANGIGSVYTHYAGSNQGHTHRGQLLGADVGVGSAAGAELGIDRWDPSGRWSVVWRRVVRQERLVTEPEADSGSAHIDVLHTIELERLLFRGSTQVLGRIGTGVNFNRDFAADRVNLNVGIEFTGFR